MSLYKYCGPRGIDILGSRRIMLTRAYGFNPFELNPHLNGIGRIQILRPQLRLNLCRIRRPKSTSESRGRLDR